MIVLFRGVASDGLRDEMKICSSRSNPRKTVCVVATGAREISLHGLHRLFPRIVPIEEIPPLFALHPEFDPLIAYEGHSEAVCGRALDPDESDEEAATIPAATVE